jgi:CelD/BcsL family acetyltransferase involved in cellulose biosynthesis
VIRDSTAPGRAEESQGDEYEGTVLRTVADLEALASQWDRLHGACPEATPFQTHAWILAWARAYLRDGDLRVAVVRSGERLVAAAPLHLRRRGPWRLLAPLGGEISDHTDVLLDPDAAPAAGERLVRVLLADTGWDLVDLPETRPDAAVHRWLAAWPGHVTRVVASTCLELPAAPAQDLLSRMPGRTANTMRRKLRKVDASGVQVRDVDAARVPAAVDELLRLHWEQWAGRGVTEEHLRDRFRGHLVDALPRMVASGQALVREYVLDGELVASQIDFLGGGALSYYLAGISPSLRARIDTAVLLVCHDVELAVSRGLARYSMLRGQEDYKLRWRPDSVVQERLLLHPPAVPARAGSGSWCGPGHTRYGS